MAVLTTSVFLVSITTELLDFFSSPWVAGSMCFLSSLRVGDSMYFLVKVLEVATEREGVWL